LSLTNYPLGRLSMNLVGKIFIVVILVTSVLFMAFAMAVYATHRNWREEVVAPEVGLQAKLEKAKSENKTLSDQADKLKEQFNAEITAKNHAVEKLTEELKSATDELKALQAKEDKLNELRRSAEAAMNTTQTNATDYRKERDTLRTKTQEAQHDSQAHFKEVVRLTTELNQAVNEKELLRKKTEDLAKDLKKADEVLRRFGLDKNKNYSNVPPAVDGVVKATLEGGLIEISLGSDDGLIKGHKLEVYRLGGGQNTYVGRIEVVRTEPNRAVCRIDPKFQNSNVMVGDRVASKIE
jgi:hypothetical protein